MKGRLLRLAWLLGLGLVGLVLLVVPSRSEVVGTGACVVHTPDESEDTVVVGLLAGPVTREPVRPRAVLLVDRPVEEWGGTVRVRAHKVFAGTAFRVAASSDPGWLCPLVEAPRDPLLRGSGFDRRGIGDRGRQTIGPCVTWPPPRDRSVVLDTTDGRLVQTHGLDPLLGEVGRDGRAPWRIEGSLDAPAEGDFVEVLDLFLDDRPLGSNTAVAPIRDGRFAVDWRGVPWAEPLLCHWSPSPRLRLRGCTTIHAPAAVRRESTIRIDRIGPFGPTDAIPAPRHLGARARLRLDLATRCPADAR